MSWRYVRESGSRRRPLRVLIAPNAFKGSLGSPEAARALARGVLQADPSARTTLLPIADGGDGLIDALLFPGRGRLIRTAVRGPLGEPRRAEFGLAGSTAVVEMARASGLALCAARRRPMAATTFGTGQLIAAALRRGVSTVVVGLGGSASSDGGAGMAQALGFELLGRDGRPIPPGAEGLLRLDRIGPSRPKVTARVIGLTDVRNPLLGTRGSARVFGPQKGATPAMVGRIEAGLRRLAEVLRRDLGVSVGALPGGGAAGGLGAGLSAFLGARLLPGAPYVLEKTGFSDALEWADVVITGEGRMDLTSFFGKAPIEAAQRARRRGRRVGMVCGSLEPGARRRLARAGVRAVSLADAGAGPRTSFSSAAAFAAKAAAVLLRSLAAAALLAAVPAFRVSAAEPAGPLAEIDRLYLHRHKEGNLDETIKRLRAMPPGPEVSWRLGRSLIRQGERLDRKDKKGRRAAFNEAEELIQSAVAAEPKNPESRFWLGLAMGRSGQLQPIWKKAFLAGKLRKEMRAVLALDPRHDGAHHVLGEIERQVPGGDEKLAIKELETAVALGPRHTAHYIALAEAYLDVGQKAKARETLEKIPSVKDPDDPAEFQENMKEAREMLEKIGH